MANIEYGSEFEFEDWYHCYINSKGNCSAYSQSTSYLRIIQDPDAISGYCFTFSSDDARSGSRRYLGDSWTYCSWNKLTTNLADDYSSLGGFIAPNSSTERAYKRGFAFNERSNSFTELCITRKENTTWKERWQIYTLSEGKDLRAWNHYAITNDGTNQYYFFNGKLIFQEVLHDPYAAEFYCSGGTGRVHRQDCYIMKDVCLWTEDFEVPDMPLYEEYTMKNIGGSGWVPPVPKGPVTNILKVY